MRRLAPSQTSKNQPDPGAVAGGNVHVFDIVAFSPDDHLQISCVNRKHAPGSGVAALEPDRATNRLSVWAALAGGSPPKEQRVTKVAG